MSLKNLLIIQYYVVHFRLIFIMESICGGAKTWALAVGLSTTFYQQCVRGEEIIGKPRN